MAYVTAQNDVILQLWAVDESRMMGFAQEWTNRTLTVHERTSVHFVVLQGSLLSITEITEYRYFSPLKPTRELRHKSEYNIVPMDLITETILFL